MNELPAAACGAAPTPTVPPRMRLARLGAAVLCALTLQPAAAEKADRNKPLQVEADRLEYDDLKQVNVFSGNVTLTKGTLTIRGDRIVVRQDPEGYQYGDAYGKPATFRQRRDGPGTAGTNGTAGSSGATGAGDQWIEGWGNRLEYDGRQETVRLHERAALRRLDGERVTDEVYGSLITYDSRTEFFTVDGGGQPAATANNPQGRVRVVIQPKQTEPTPPAPARLQPAERIASPRPPDPPVPGSPASGGAAPSAAPRP